MSAADRVIAGAAGATVVVLAGVAGAISYSHMAELARVHGETGWRAHAFPVSVDGIEIVASLVLLAHRRAGSRSGWLPWAALVAGTLASVAANVAVGGSDLVGRLVAGWPAVALLVAIKLMSTLLDSGGPAGRGGDHVVVPDGPGMTAIFAAGGPAAPAVVPDGPGPVPNGATGDHSGGGDHAGTDDAPAAIGDVGGSACGGPVAGGVGLPVGLGPVAGTGPAGLVDAARSVRDRLVAAVEPVNRRNLAAGLRAAGYRVRNDRLGSLLRLVVGVDDQERPPPAVAGSSPVGPDGGGVHV